MKSLPLLQLVFQGIQAPAGDSDYVLGEVYDESLVAFVRRSLETVEPRKRKAGRASVGRSEDEQAPAFVEVMSFHSKRRRGFAAGLRFQVHWGRGYTDIRIRWRDKFMEP